MNELRQEEKAMNKTGKPQNTTPASINDRIAGLAYQLWEKGGHLAGHDLEYWLQAEKRIRAATRPTSQSELSHQHQPH